MGSVYPSLLFCHFGAFTVVMANIDVQTEWSADETG
jgi:hypothetical protein